MDDYLGKMDDMIEKSASAVTGIDYANVDDITRTRLRLLRRLYGGAIRLQQLIAPAAYVGGVVLTLPRMLDRTTKDEQVIKGFMPVLTASLGAGSFDHHRLEDEDHFTTYLHPDRLTHDPHCPRLLLCREEDAGRGGGGTGRHSRCRAPLGTPRWDREPLWTSSSAR